jgi:sugar phosphate isomerase/epimerase
VIPFQTSGLRVFGGKIGTLPRAEAVQIASEILYTLADIGEEYGVKILVETHDDWTNSLHVKQLLEAVDRPSVGVVWDMHHTWLGGESFQNSWDFLGPWIANTHWKDSRKDPDSVSGYQHCIPGDGEFDFQAVQNGLILNQYTGWYTLEWEKRWHPELPEPDVVFPKYVSVMQDLLKTKQR